MSLLLNDKMAMRQPIIGMLRRHLPSFAQPRGLTARACFSSMRFGGPAVLPCSPSSPPSLGRLHGGMLCPHPPMPERQAHRSSSVAHPPRLAAPRPAAATRSDFFLAEEGTTFSSVGFPPPSGGGHPQGRLPCAQPDTGRQCHATAGRQNRRDCRRDGVW